MLEPITQMTSYELCLINIHLQFLQVCILSCNRSTTSHQRLTPICPHVKTFQTSLDIAFCKLSFRLLPVCSHAHGEETFSVIALYQIFLYFIRPFFSVFYIDDGNPIHQNSIPCIIYMNIFTNCQGSIPRKTAGFWHHKDTFAAYRWSHTGMHPCGAVGCIALPAHRK